MTDAEATRAMASGKSKSHAPRAMHGRNEPRRAGAVHGREVGGEPLELG